MEAGGGGEQEDKDLEEAILESRMAAAHSASDAAVAEEVPAAPDTETSARDLLALQQGRGLSLYSAGMAG